MLSFATLFAAFSVACAFTHDLPSMIAMRGFQGFFGGVLIPMAFTLVFTKLPKGQQPIGLAMFSLAVTFAPAIGPTIGGYLTENYGWQTIFFVNVLPTAVMVTILFFTLERQPMNLGLLREGDWFGIATMAVGIISSYDDVNSILLAGRADLCLLGRAHLYDPNWTLHAAAEQGYVGPAAQWPLPWRAGARKPQSGRAEGPRPRLELIRTGTVGTAHRRWRPA